MQIVGVSFDSPTKNQKWAEEEGYAFELWTDDDKTLALTYGAADSTSDRTADRITRIIGSDGVLMLEYNSVSTGVHPQQVLDDCLILFGD